MTITHTHYVGMVVPHCALTYSIAPCQAQLSPANFIIDTVQFNGEYATRGAGLTGAADSKMLTCAFWFRMLTSGANDYLFAGATAVNGATEASIAIRRFADHISIDAYNSGLTKIMNLLSTTTLVPFNWYHCMFSVDLSSTTKRHLYIDNVDALNPNIYTNDTIDFTVADWSFGAKADGTAKWEGAFGEFYFNPGTYIDLSVAANRAKFITSTLRPFGMGANGDIPTGAQPAVWVRSDGSIANNGSGGTFTTKGAGVEAVIGFQTGDVKCFNSLSTCQDIANFDESGNVVLYFGEDVTNRKSFILDAGSPLFPFVKSIDYNSAIVSLGDNMGQRGSITIKMRDGRTNDTPNSVFDKYASERGYDPLDFGTFWGRFRARNPYMRFQPIILFVVKKGSGGENDELIESRSYVIESISGPDGGTGEVTITAKDALKVADGDFAKAPVQSEGFLQADITDVATTAVISPTGSLVDYPSSGYACIGGNEVVSYSKTGGDNVSITRHQLGTTASAHSAQDRFQLVLRYVGQSPDLIIADLLTTYAGMDASLIDEVTWAAEVAAYLGTVYTFNITEPTDVKDLVSEVIQQIGGAIWWDDVNSQVRLQILRTISTDAERWNEDNTVFDTLKVTEQENKRVTRCSVYFAQINPTLKVDETRNYASVATVMDEATENLVGGQSIKTIFARGIGTGGRTVAEALGNKYLGRYVKPPRRFNLELMKYSGPQPVLGGGYLIGGGTIQGALYQDGVLQDEDGLRVEVPVQVTRVNPVGYTYQVEAEEMVFTSFGSAIAPTVDTIILDFSRNNINLQEIHDALYAVAQSGDTVNCYVVGGVIIGSDDVNIPAFTVGTFAGGVTVNIIVNGRIQGKGGDGDGSNRPAPHAGQPGGTALYTRQAINLTNNSEIWGGGGGGGVSNGSVGSDNFSNSGGGGAGTQPGIGGTPFNATFKNQGGAGTSETFGDAPFSPVGGDGGSPGQPGQNAAGGAFFNTNGGAAGNGVDGTSFVTYAVTGDIRGPQIN